MQEPNEGANCRFCPGLSQKTVVFSARDGVLSFNNSWHYLDGPGAQERLAQTCEGHVYLAGLTPAVQHPATGKWVPGVVYRVGGRNEDDHPFYADLDVPLGMSPAEVAKIQFSGCSVGPMDDGDGLSYTLITLDDLFPYGMEHVLETGLETDAENQ